MSQRVSDQFEMGTVIAAKRHVLRSPAQQMCLFCREEDRQDRLISAVYVWIDGTHFLWIPGQRGTRRDGRRAKVAPRAIRLHNEPDGRPRVEFAGCGHCGRAHVLTINADHVAVEISTGPST